MRTFLRLYSDSFDSSGICCTGSQLSKIVVLLNETLGEFEWYTADVSPVFDSLLNPEFRPKHLGNSSKLINEVATIEQFESGVFIGVELKNTDPILRDTIYTDDEPTCEIGDATVEIRAFDYTVFELISNRESDIEHLSLEFDVPLEH